MGAIYKHDINDLIKKYNLTYYVETGTGEGVCLEHARKYNFKKLYSIEIHDILYNNAISKFKNDTRCSIVLGNSYDVLPNLLSNLDDNTLFFLDAHFPGADFNFSTYASEVDIKKRLPLEYELITIRNNFDTKNSVIIIDDLRIYEDGPFEGGNWTDRHLYGSDSINFVYTMFSNTHDIIKDYRDQGYLILLPK